MELNSKTTKIEISDNTVNNTANSDDMGKRPAKTNDISWISMIANIICHIIIFGFTALITYMCFVRDMQLFHWHPFLLTFGYFICMSEAILAFADTNLLTNRLSFKNRIFFHWILQAVGGIAIVAGFTVIILNKNRLGKLHFQTYHAVFGLISIICTILAILGGIYTKYSFQLRQYLRPVYAKIMHSIVGSIAYILGIIAIIFGVYTRFFIENTSREISHLSFASIIFVTLVILTKPLLIAFARIKGSCMRASL